MRFGVFYELQLPKPWDDGAEHRLVHEAIEQVELADRLGIQHAWAVEHHFLEEYSHCSASDVFLANLGRQDRADPHRTSASARSSLGYNHAGSDRRDGRHVGPRLRSGRVDFGIGEGARPGSSFAASGSTRPVRSSALSLRSSRADRQHDGDGSLSRS